MGFLSSLTGGGATDAAKNVAANSFYLPSNINLPGFNIGYQNPGPLTNKDWKNIRSGRQAMPEAGVTGGLTPEQAGIRDMFSSGIGGFLGQAYGGVPGYGGISPELMNEFGLANYDIGNLYAPQVPDTAMQNFLNASGDFLGRAQNMPQFDIQGETQKQLDLMRQYDAPYEQRGMMQNWDQQFGRGILDSTAGQYQTQAIADSFHQKDLARQMQAYQNALAGGQFNLAQQGQYAQQGLGFGQAAGDLGNLSFGQQYALNQLGGQRAADRFARAQGLFGLGQGAQQTGVQNALGLLSGQGQIDSFLANLMGLGGNLGSQRSAANNAAYSPMVGARAAQDAAIGGLVGGALNFAAGPLAAGIGNIGQPGGFFGGMGNWGGWGG